MTMIGSEDLLICKTCGTQFDTPFDKPLTNCRICDDPRQYVPPSGQAWTSLRELQGKHKNTIKQDEVEPRMWSIFTEPQVAIGQRAIFLQTDHGNVLWDCITYLDQETVDWINEKGGLKAIVISHPHYYSTHLDWAATFGCPVYFGEQDTEWLSRVDSSGKQVALKGTMPDIGIPGVQVAIPGGHFPGSALLVWNKMLFIADTFAIVPSGLNPNGRLPGTASFVFMYSYPNMLPLSADTLAQMWKVMKKLEFESTHGAFFGRDIRDKNVKARVLESMQIQAKCMGYSDHQIFQESLS